MSSRPLCTTQIEFLHWDTFHERMNALLTADTAIVLSESAAKRFGLETRIEDAVWLSDFASNPTPKDIAIALKTISDRKVKRIIAVGGGSAIDLAKGVSAFYGAAAGEDEILAGILSKTYTGHLEIIAVPTTSGTGSEVTQWATIWDMNGKRKLSIDHPSLKPDVSLIVPELTATASPKLTLSAGLDALCHACEAYWAKATNPLAQEMAFRAVEIIVGTLKNVIKFPDDFALRERMCRASVLSGLAFSQTRTTACHSISYPITMYFNVPHGFACALSLAQMFDINGKYVDLKSLKGLFDGDVQEWIDGVSAGIQEMRLSAFGIGETDIEKIASGAFTQGRMDNNPAPIDQSTVTKVLQNIYS